MLIQNWLRWWTADEKADQQTWFYLAVYLLLALGHWLSLTGIGTVSFLIVPTSGRNLHSQLLRTVVNGPRFVTSTDIATTLSRFSQDMKQIDRRLPAQVAALGSQAFNSSLRSFYFSWRRHTCYSPFRFFLSSSTRFKRCTCSPAGS